MSVGRICTRNVQVAALDESAQESACRMQQQRVGSLVIVDGENRPVGIVTDRDLALRVVGKGLDPSATRLSYVMSEVPESVTEDMPIESAIVIMRRGGHRRLPVIDENENLIGLITLDDVLSHLSEEFEEIGELVRKEGP